MCMCVCTFNIRNLKITFQKIFSVSMLSIYSLRQQLKFSFINFKLKFPVPLKYFTLTKFTPCPNLKKVRQFSSTDYFFLSIFDVCGKINFFGSFETKQEKNYFTLLKGINTKTFIWPSRWSGFCLVYLNANIYFLSFLFTMLKVDMKKQNCPPKIKIDTKCYFNQDSRGKLLIINRHRRIITCK